MSRISEFLSTTAQKRFPVEQKTRSMVRTVAVVMAVAAGVFTLVATTVLAYGALHPAMLATIFMGIKRVAAVIGLVALTAYVGSYLFTRDTQEADRELRNLKQAYKQARENDGEFKARMKVLRQGQTKNRLYVAQESAKLAQEMTKPQSGVGYPKAIEFAQSQYNELARLANNNSARLDHEIEHLKKKEKSYGYLEKHATEEQHKAKLALQPLKETIDKLLHEAFDLAVGHYEKGEIEKGKALMRSFKGKALDGLLYAKIEAELRAGVDIESLFIQLDRISDKKDARWIDLESKLEIFKLSTFLDSAEEIVEKEREAIIEIFEDIDADDLRDTLARSFAYANMRLGKEEKFITNTISLVYDKDLKRELNADYELLKIVRDTAHHNASARLDAASQISEPFVKDTLARQIKEQFTTDREIEKDILEELGRRGSDQGEVINRCLSAADKIVDIEVYTNVMEAILAA